MTRIAQATSSLGRCELDHARESRSIPSTLPDAQSHRPLNNLIYADPSNAQPSIMLLRELGWVRRPRGLSILRVEQFPAQIHSAADLRAATSRMQVTAHHIGTSRSRKPVWDYHKTDMPMAHTSR